MTSMKKIYNMAFCLSLVLACAACGSDEPAPAYPSDACYDFVTVSALNSGGAEFTLQKSGDSELITYTAAQALSDTIFQEGRRMIIQYKRSGDAMPYTSGPITLYGYRPLDNTRQNLVYAVSDEWTSNLIDVVMITRTGPYINMQANLYCSRALKPREFVLEVDPDQIGLDYPEARVRYVQPEPGENAYTGYASFDVSALWNRDSCKGITVSYRTPSGVKSTLFEK